MIRRRSTQRPEEAERLAESPEDAAEEAEDDAVTRDRSRGVRLGARSVYRTASRNVRAAASTRTMRSIQLLQDLQVYVTTRTRLRDI